MGYTGGIIIPLTWQHISYKFLNPKGIGEMPIYSIVHCIMVGESASTNSLKYLVPCFISIIVAGEMEVSDLYKTFLDFLF